MSKDKIQRVTVGGALLFEGKALIVRRSKEQKYFPDHYELPGGKVEFGEDLGEALVREFKEETNLDVEVGESLRSFSWITDDGEEHVTEFVYKVSAKNVDNLTLSKEHSEHKWVQRSGLEGLKIDPEIMASLDMVLPEVDDQATTSEETLHVFTDGGSRGNPGPSASGYVIMTTKEEILEEGGEYLGITTNNQAEYLAGKLAVEEAKKFNPTELNFFIDSLLVVNQMNGAWKIKNKELWPVHQAIKDLVAEYEKVTFKHVRREYNTLADEQVNIVLDSRKESSEE